MFLAGLAQAFYHPTLPTYDDHRLPQPNPHPWTQIAKACTQVGRLLKALPGRRAELVFLLGIGSCLERGTLRVLYKAVRHTTVGFVAVWAHVGGSNSECSLHHATTSLPWPFFFQCRHLAPCTPLNWCRAVTSPLAVRYRGPHEGARSQTGCI